MCVSLKVSDKQKYKSNNKDNTEHLQKKEKKKDNIEAFFF